MEKLNVNKEPPLTQTFLVCIAKNHGHPVRIDGEKTFVTSEWIRKDTLERGTEETDVTGYTYTQIKQYLGY